MGESRPICLPTSSHPGQSSGETTGLPKQENHSDCSRVPQHALLSGSSGHVKPDYLLPAQRAHIAVQSETEHQTPVLLVKGVLVSLTQFSFQEPADQRGSRQCGSSGYSSPGPNSG